MSKFEAQVSAWVKKSNARITAVFKTATQAVIEEAQVPVARGGKMRVDTGFLRSSGTASLGGLPYGPSKRGEGMGDFGNFSLTIQKASLGDSIWFGWTAEYARPREALDGFMRSAAQNWVPIVNRVSAEIKARFG